MHEINSKYDKESTNIKKFDDLWEWSINNSETCWKEVSSFTNMQSTPLINNSSNNANTEHKINSKNMWEQLFFFKH